jgi:hypothetical protein
MMKFICTTSCPHLFNRSTATLDGHFSVLNMYFYEKHVNMKLDWLFNYKHITNSDKDEQDGQCTYDRTLQCIHTIFTPPQLSQQPNIISLALLWQFCHKKKSILGSSDKMSDNFVQF